MGCACSVWGVQMYLKGMLSHNKSGQDRSTQDPNFFELNYCESKFFCQIGKQNNFWDPKSFAPNIFCQAQPRLNSTSTSTSRLR